MSEINETAVLEALKKYGSLSWAEFTSKGIFLNIENGTPRAGKLGDALHELENHGLIERKPGAPPTWVVTLKGREVV
jgi:hypothetical protein